MAGDGLDKGRNSSLRNFSSSFSHTVDPYPEWERGVLCEGLRLGYLPIQTTMRCDRNGGREIHESRGEAQGPGGKKRCGREEERLEEWGGKIRGSEGKMHGLGVRSVLLLLL
jgi:hypothetical protein